ncbi:MAG: hypothetical protein ONB44_08055 [candidate division KSB1 bacterium]|nr:hypothetical protein [candidate division KSB1 bacterium]MDZ7302081.1 hypothetical protein [candidate division KSB1 bacterium]MDZ7311122.1 hypothetical protein [candidate division KSB1 bacterium]
MYYLTNQYLTVAVLDPIRDQARLGPRFCTGGYVYQIEDAKFGPLLSGPEFPAEQPAVTNGQGLPEVFQFTLYDDECQMEEEKLIIGVGLVDKQDPSLPYHLLTNAYTKEFCIWQVFPSGNSIRMETTQTYKKWSLQLVKDVWLVHRTVTSHTHLRNIGRTLVRFRWFAHPFFPLNPSWECCQFLMPARLPDNPAYFLNASGVIEMNRHYHWREGFFQLLENCQGREFMAIQLHPQLEQIYVSGDFPLSKVAMWANDRTFSFEPFYEDVVPANQEKSWSLAFHF